MRYIQIKKPDGSYELVEAHRVQQARERTLDVFVQADLEPFRSVVDNSIISSRRDLNEHNRRNNVVSQAEFGTEKERASFYARKEKERADVYQGTTNTHVGKRMKQERIQHIIEAMQKHERS